MRLLKVIVMFLKHRKSELKVDAFEDELTLEMLRSNKLRVNILIVVVLVAHFSFLSLSLFSFGKYQSTFHGRFHIFLIRVVVTTCIVLLCLFIERAFINHYIKIRRKPHASFLYLSAFLEASIPTIGIISVATIIDPLYALFAPPLLAYPVIIVLSALRLNFRLCIFTGAVASLEYTLLALFYTLEQSTAAQTIEPMLSETIHHLPKGLMLFVTGVVTGFVTLQIKERLLNSFLMAKERDRISRTFGEHVSPAVMEKLLEQKADLRSEKKNVCVMFLDIRGFTSYAEKRTPEEVVAYLESLFEFMIEIVNRHNGIINKFLGDGFMAVFGAPLSDEQACLNAIAASQEILFQVNEEIARGNISETRIGIGLHAGEAVTGSIGSSLRREYTVIGDVVNMASRIEKLNKKFNSQLLISDAVREALEEKASGVVSMGAVQVRGHETAIQIYKVA